MTTPRVIELPRRMEPTSLDTFLGGRVAEIRPLATVVPLRARDVAGHRPVRRRRGRPLFVSGDPGPGGDAA
jgi:hypothetical protein